MARGQPNAVGTEASAPMTLSGCPERTVDIRLSSRAAWTADGQHYRLAVPSGSEYVRLTLVTHLVVLPEQVGPTGWQRTQTGVRRSPALGAPALLEALFNDLEHAFDVALDFDVDRAGECPEYPHN